MKFILIKHTSQSVYHLLLIYPHYCLLLIKCRAQIEHHLLLSPEEAICWLMSKKWLWITKYKSTKTLFQQADVDCATFGSFVAFHPLCDSVRNRGCSELLEYNSDHEVTVQSSFLAAPESQGVHRSHWQSRRHTYRITQEYDPTHCP